MVSVEKLRRQKLQQQRHSQQVQKQLDMQKSKIQVKLIEKIKENKEGKKVQMGNIINCHYTGRLPNGKKFDSSRDRKEPFQFTVGQQGLIEGWSQIALQMNEGERKVFQIPYQLAYGEKGIPPVIPGKTDLIFDLEILEIVDAEKMAQKLKEEANKEQIEVQQPDQQEEQEEQKQQ